MLRCVQNFWMEFLRTTEASNGARLLGKVPASINFSDYGSVYQGS
jgi:hypothetical protein